MPENSRSEKYNDYKKLIPELPDEEIVYILKRRSYYQEQARELAISEAIKRGIINSEQDLFSDEYHVKPVNFSLFPSIEDKKNREKITKSIARVLLICGVLPFVWGIIRLNFGALTEGIVLIIFGATWIFCAARIMLKYRKENVLILYLLLFISCAYFIKIILLKKGTFIFMDIFIPVVLYLFIVYGLLFLGKLNS
jgi:hypothetical protein